MLKNLAVVCSGLINQSSVKVHAAVGLAIELQAQNYLTFSPCFVLNGVWTASSRTSFLPLLFLDYQNFTKSPTPSSPACDAWSLMGSLVQSSF